MRLLILLLILLSTGCRTSNTDGARLLRELDAQFFCDPEGAIQECPGLVYVWSSAMPLSRTGMPNISEASAALGLSVTMLTAEFLTQALQAASARTEAAAIADFVRVFPVLEQMAQSGVLLHSPAIVVHRSGQLLGSPILGYRTTEAYQSMIAERLESVPPVSVQSGEEIEPNRELGADEISWEGHRIPGTPGAFFRVLPDQRVVALESEGSNYLWALGGQLTAAPGFLDLIPSPDGRLFATPGDEGRGMEFYAAPDPVSGDWESYLLRDAEMRDQYPSIGLLSQGAQGQTYRVLTSWTERARFRDYEMSSSESGWTVRPMAAAVVTCPELQISLPVISKDGTSLAARDEGTGTTKIFGLDSSGACTELLDLGVPTGKVTFDSLGRRIAFFARVEDAQNDDPRGSLALYVVSLEALSVLRIPLPRPIQTLTFADFLGPTELALILPDSLGEAHLQVACCLPP